MHRQILHSIRRPHRERCDNSGRQCHPRLYLVGEPFVRRSTQFDRGEDNGSRVEVQKFFGGD